MLNRVTSNNDKNEAISGDQDTRARSIKTWITGILLLSPFIANLFWAATKSPWLYWGARIALGVEMIVVGALFLIIPGTIVRWVIRNLLFSRRITSPENWSILPKRKLHFGNIPDALL